MFFRLARLCTGFALALFGGLAVCTCAELASAKRNPAGLLDYIVNTFRATTRNGIFSIVILMGIASLVLGIVLIVGAIFNGRTHIHAEIAEDKELFHKQS